MTHTLSGSRIRLLRQFLLFAGVGALGTVAHYTTLVALVEWLRCAPVPASAIGALVGMVVNYLLNYRFTFRSAKPHREAATKFFLVGGAGLLWNLLLMWLLAERAGFHYLIAQAGATGLVLLWQFGLSRFWVFAQTHGDAHNRR